jgi:hypothetical protein
MKRFVGKLLVVLLTPLLLAAPLNGQCLHDHETHAASDVLSADCCCNLHHSDSSSSGAHGHLPEATRVDSGNNLRPIAWQEMSSLMPIRWISRVVPVRLGSLPGEHYSVRTFRLSVQLLI